MLCVLLIGIVCSTMLCGLAFALVVLNVCFFEPRPHEMAALEVEKADKPNASFEGNKRMAQATHRESSTAPEFTPSPARQAIPQSQAG